MNHKLAIRRCCKKSVQDVEMAEGMVMLAPFKAQAAPTRVDPADA